MAHHKKQKQINQKTNNSKSHRKRSLRHNERLNPINNVQLKSNVQHNKTIFIYKLRYLRHKGIVS